MVTFTEREPERHFGRPYARQGTFVKMEAVAFVGRCDVKLETPDQSEVKSLRQRLDDLMRDLFPELTACNVPAKGPSTDDRA